MMSRLTLAAALLSSLSTTVAAQPPVCDGSEMSRLEQRRRVGGGITAATFAANVLVFAVAWARSSPTPEGAPEAIERGRRAMNFALVSLPGIFAGQYLYQTSYPDEDFWERAVARMKIGETTSADVRLCLHTPSARSSAGAEERWTYFMTRPGGRRFRRSSRSVTFTFSDGVLTEIRRSEVNLPEGQAWPVLPPSSYRSRTAP